MTREEPPNYLDQLQSYRSVGFRPVATGTPTPGTGKIAVKVINHYGDEVMKVLEVGTVRG